MHGHDHRSHSGHVAPGPLRPDDTRRKLRASWVFWAFVAIAALFLVKEHGAHLLGAWPWILIAACPLLHMFMHGGHGGHGGHDDGPDPRQRPVAEDEPGRGR